MVLPLVLKPFFTANCYLKIMENNPQSKIENHQSLTDYPTIISQAIQWGEMDAANHVNNAVYMRYFESARIEFFNRMGFMDFTGDDGIGPILAEVNCKYKAPLTFPDNIKITARILPDSLTEYGFVMQHVVYSEKLKRIAAEGTSRIVCYDYKNKRKALIPKELIDKMGVM